ncbi:MAG: prohibitin family protein [Anaerolineales bacterium]|nr:prohibitin family protein [Anaerolineales bacterium]
MDESPGNRFVVFVRRLYARVSQRLHAYRHELAIFAFMSAAAFVFLLPNMWNTIPAGHLGVLWKRFEGGTVTDRVFVEGTLLILPWDRLYVYDARLQQVQEEVQVLASDGLQITLTLAWRFHLNPQTVPMLHKFVGPNYDETLVAPTVAARARDVVAVYRPEEIYTESRLKIQSQVLESVRYDLYNNFNPGSSEKFTWMIMEDVLIKAITLPPGVQEAIVRKNAAFHEIDEFAFRVQKEEKEAERKRIEAVGIRNFQEIVSNGMSDAYLRWRGIEATLDLAKSPNAKVVVIGNNKNGLPLILNMDSKEGVELSSAATAKPKPKTGPK